MSRRGSTGSVSSSVYYAAGMEDTNTDYINNLTASAGAVTADSVCVIDRWSMHPISPAATAASRASSASNGTNSTATTVNARGGGRNGGAGGGAAVGRFDPASNGAAALGEVKGTAPRKPGRQKSFNTLPAELMSPEDSDGNNNNSDSGSSVEDTCRTHLVGGDRTNTKGKETASASTASAAAPTPDSKELLLDADNIEKLLLSASSGVKEELRPTARVRLEALVEQLRQEAADAFLSSMPTRTNTSAASGGNDIDTQRSFRSISNETNASSTDCRGPFAARPYSPVLTSPVRTIKSNIRTMVDDAVTSTTSSTADTDDNNRLDWSPVSPLSCASTIMTGASSIVLSDPAPRLPGRRKSNAADNHTGMDGAITAGTCTNMDDSVTDNDNDVTDEYSESYTSTANSSIIDNVRPPPLDFGCNAPGSVHPPRLPGRRKSNAPDTCRAEDASGRKNQQPQEPQLQQQQQQQQQQSPANTVSSTTPSVLLPTGIGQGDREALSRTAESDSPVEKSSSPAAVREVPTAANVAGIEAVAADPAPPRLPGRRKSNAPDPRIPNSSSLTSSSESDDRKEHCCDHPCFRTSSCLTRAGSDSVINVLDSQLSMPFRQQSRRDLIC